MTMATRAPERGRLERRQVARAEVLATDTTGVLARTHKTGQTLDLWVSDAMGAHTPRSYKPVPFWLTTGGWGVFLHTSSRVTEAVGGELEVAAPVGGEPVGVEVDDVHGHLGGPHLLHHLKDLLGRAVEAAALPPPERPGGGTGARPVRAV